MTPRQFEEIVCEHYRKHGYKVELTPLSGDYGVDIFAVKNKERLAVQVKMYGNTTRKINRQTVMKLHGAKDYFDCTKAVIVTDGVLLSNAVKVAKKLKVEVFYMQPSHTVTSPSKRNNLRKEISFESIWEQYIMPLEGKTLYKSNGETNVVTKVDWSGVERITSSGNKGKIKIEIFKQSINKLLKSGNLTRDEVNQNYTSRASSGIILMLSQVPLFTLNSNPVSLTFYVK
jgi:Holliday junction resolvase